MNQLHVLKLGSTFPELAARQGDFEDWVLREMGLGRDEVVLVDVAAGEPLPSYESVGSIVVTGSHAMVTDREPWSQRTAQWLAGLVERAIPVLGICYGHQLLAEALGGRSGDNPNGREFGLAKLSLTPAAANDPLFHSFSASPAVYVCHSQSVLRLPPGAVLLASSRSDPRQAFRFGECVWGVQFHPEFNVETIIEYIDRFHDVLEQEGQDPEKLIAACAATSAGSDILARFCSIALNC
jgi:GMP synthase (glutamine-hydrolysing)